MKSYSFSMIAAILMTASLAAMTGCEYDAAQPLWYEDFQPPATPRITQIDPEQATAGVNTITLRGENFAGASGTNDVYFDVVPAEIISSSATTITVRRPNYVTDSSTVKVVSDQAFLVAKFDKPYKIAPVVKLHGNYPENLRISAVAVDQAENVYAVMFTSRDILQIMPDGQTTVVARATRAPTDSRTGPDGRIYFPGNNRSIDVLDVATKTVTTWLQFPSANPQKFVKFGDFDASGYFYTGGTRTDLMIVAPDLSSQAAGFYPTTAGSANNDIIAVRVFNGYVYVVTRTTPTGTATIWRHSIGAGGTLGAQEMVLDMSTTPFASRTIRSLTFSTNGAMFIGTGDADPLLVVDPTTGAMDLFYKGILPAYCSHFQWGRGDFLYMVSGDGTANNEWKVFRVDMGTTSAP